VIQSDLLTQLPKNFYLDAFWSVGLNDNNLSSDAGDEIDWTVGWGTKVFDKLGIDLHISYYDLFDIFHYRNEDLIFPYAEINYGDIDLFDWLHFTPYLALENPFSAKGDDLSSGILAHAGIRHTINVIDMVDIVGRFDFLYDDGALGLDNSLIGRYEIGMQWKVNKYLSIAGPWIKYSDLYTRVSAFDPRQDEIVYGGGLILIFGL